MGGHAAEEIVFGKGKVSTGASSDFQTATRTATRMVSQYGMSESFGKMSFSARDLEKLSPVLRTKLNDEVKCILDSSYERVLRLLKKNDVQFRALTEAVFDRNTLSELEIKQIVGLEK